MTSTERTELLTRAIRVYGEPAQVDMAIEEMSELTKALCKVKRAQGGPWATEAVSNVIEEIADVQIMLDQLRIIFGGSSLDIEEKKLHRLEKRLDSRYMESNLHKWIGQNWPGRHIDAGGGGHGQQEMSEEQKAIDIISDVLTEGFTIGDRVFGLNNEEKWALNTAIKALKKKPSAKAKETHDDEGGDTRG